VLDGLGIVVGWGTEGGVLATLDPDDLGLAALGAELELIGGQRFGLRVREQVYGAKPDDLVGGRRCRLPERTHRQQLDQSQQQAVPNSLERSASRRRQISDHRVTNLDQDLTMMTAGLGALLGAL